MILTGAINIILIAILSYLVYRAIVPRLKPFFFITILLLKLLGGIAVGWVYFYHYEIGDTIQYHEAATLLANTARSDLSMFFSVWDDPIPQFVNQPRAWLMVQVTAIAHILTNSNYWISSLWFSFFSFTGLYFLISKIITVWPKQQVSAFIAFMIWPSVVFWSSGIVKESIMVGALGLLLGCYLYFFKIKRNYFYLACSLIFLVILWYLKYYVAAVVILVLLPVALANVIRSASTNLIIILGLIIGVAFIILSHPNFNPQYFTEVIYHNYTVFLNVSDPGDAVTYPYHKKDFWFIVLNAPFALVASVFRPLLDIQGGFPALIASVENMLLFLLFSGWILAKVVKKKPLDNVEVIIIAYVVILGIFLGLSTPNLGTLSRYRVSFLPFLIWMLINDNLIIARIVNLSEKRIWT